jgi:hypothetical protein
MRSAYSDRQDRSAAAPAVAVAAPLAHHAGIIAIAAGALFAGAQLMAFATTDRSDLTGTLAAAPYRVAAVILLVAFTALAIAAVALYERQAAQAGRLGAAGVCAALVGTFFLGGDYWFETFAVPWYAVVLPEMLRIPGAGWLAVGGTTSYVLFSTGWVLFAISSMRVNVIPRRACVALIFGGVIGFYAALPPYGVVLGLALVWVGFGVLRSAAQQRPQPPVGTGQEA